MTVIKPGYQKEIGEGILQVENINIVYNLTLPCCR